MGDYEIKQLDEFYEEQKATSRDFFHRLNRMFKTYESMKSNAPLSHDDKYQRAMKNQLDYLKSSYMDFVRICEDMYR